jgi:hypothetical protein
MDNCCLKKRITQMFNQETQEEKSLSVCRGFSVESTGPVSATARWTTAATPMSFIATATATALDTVATVVAVVTHGVTMEGSVKD